jgi:hypothetical protein
MKDKDMRMTSGFAAKLCFCLFVCGLLLMGCGLFDEAEKKIVRPVVDILDEAVETLENGSLGWQSVLQNMVDELEANGHTLVRNDVSNLLSRAIQDSAVEVRCTVDFMRDRVKEDLIRLRARFTGEELVLVPVFCVPNPPSVDYAFVESGNLTSITIDGYNLDAAKIKVYLVDRQNQRVDVSAKLGNPARYVLTLNLGSNGVPLTAQSDRIEFELPSGLQSVNINQPRAVEQVETVQPFITEPFCPERIGGDREFDGNGPDVEASAFLYTSADQRELWARIELHVKETKSDWSEAQGTWDLPVWPGKLGAKITGFTPNTPSTTAYRDNNHQVDIPSISGGALVQRFEILGDTDDDDIGNCTLDDVYVKVFFNQIQVSYIAE